MKHLWSPMASMPMRLSVLPFFRLMGFAVLFSSSLQAGEYYVATNGVDSNPGSKERPFATIQRAQQSAEAGDTVFVRGGLYQMREDQIARKTGLYAYVTHLNKIGRPDAPIRYAASPGEKPVFDYSRVKPARQRVAAFYVSGSWIHLKGLDVKGVQVTIKTHTQSICFYNDGSSNLYENLSMHDGQAIGIYSVRGSSNLFLNCDAYNNFDYTSENGMGGNADGFGCHPPEGSMGNVFRGCRAWWNSDDGFDCINAHESVTFENCWAFENGFSSSGRRLADGNGFKAGGYGSTPVDLLPRVIPRHQIRNCLAVHNKASGFYANHHPGGCDWWNNTAFRNGNNFNMLGRLMDNKTDIPGKGHVLQFNLAFKGGREWVNMDADHCTSTNNFFSPGIALNDSDFLSLDTAQMMAPRQPDGSLPAITLMHVSPAGAAKIKNSITGTNKILFPGAFAP